MNRGKRNWTRNKFERYIREGRGQGQGESYKPWITIQDFPSQGRSARCPGWKTNRVHHFLSDLRSLFNILKFRLSKSNGTINQVTTALDREMNIEPGTSLYLFKHLLARKEILMDMLTQKVSGCPSTQAILGNSFN